MRQRGRPQFTSVDHCFIGVRKSVHWPLETLRDGLLHRGSYTSWQSGRSLLHRGQSTFISGHPQSASVGFSIVVREPVALATGIV